MTPQQNGETASVPAMLVELMVTNGRIVEAQKTIIIGQEKLENRVMAENAKLESRIGSLEARNRALEKLVERMDATKPEKTKFVNIVTAIAASVAIVLGFANLSIIQQNRTQQAVQLELLQKNQDALIQKVHP